MVAHLRKLRDESRTNFSNSRVLSPENRSTWPCRRDRTHATAETFSLTRSARKRVRATLDQDQAQRWLNSPKHQGIG
jgi:hypothetical protein